MDIIRWTAKKTLRHVLCARRPAFPSPQIHVVTYHGFGLNDPWSVDPGIFEKNIKWLAENDRFCDLRGLKSFLDEGAQGRGGVVVTIDDCHPSVMRHALPVLREYAVPAILFAIVDRIGEDDHMSAAQLRGCARDGISIGSHSLTHPRIAELPPDRMEAEICLSKERLADIVGQNVEAFAYPYGNRSTHNRASRTLLEAAGYEVAFISTFGPVLGDTDRFALPRINIERGDMAWTFPHVCAGALDAWDDVCRRVGLARMQT